MKQQSCTIKNSEVQTARPKNSFCSAQIHKNKSPEIILKRYERQTSKRTIMNCHQVGLIQKNKEGLMPEIIKGKRYVNPLEVIIHRKQ